MILLEALAVYALIGAATALAFLTRGIARVLGSGESVTLPARCLLFPGALLFLAADPDPVVEGRAMRRIHRAVHRRLWPVLAPIVLILFALALYLGHPA